MAQFIDRDSFLRFLGKEYPGQAPHGAIVVGLLADYPTAEDVRPVVLCDDCRYANRTDLFELWCNGFCHPARLVRPDDFCSHGEAAT